MITAPAARWLLIAVFAAWLQAALFGGGAPGFGLAGLAGSGRYGGPACLPFSVR